MKSQQMTSSGVNPVTIILILATGLLVFFALSGRKIPLINTDRTTLLILVGLGMSICTAGIGRVAENGAWLHPLAIIAYLVGGFILIVGMAALFGRVLPPLSSFRQGIIVVSILMGAKILVSSIHRFIF